MLEKYSINLYKNEEDLLLVCQYLFMHNIEEWKPVQHRVVQSKVGLSDISYHVFLTDEDVFYLTIALKEGKVISIDENRTKISRSDFKTRFGILDWNPT